MELHDCLKLTPRRTLRWVLHLWGKKPGRNPLKHELEAQMLRVLRAPGLFARVRRMLTMEEYAALEALAAQEGPMAQELFCARFGPIRLYQPWKPGSPRAPGVPGSPPAERLAYLGLIYPLAETEQILLPDEFRGLFRPPPPTTAVRLMALPKANLLPEPHIDMALLLALLCQESPRLWRGRWLPPTFLQDVNERLLIPEDLSGVKSELQSGRLRFLHFLAEATGLVEESEGSLTLTVQGWQWLREEPITQLQQLWDAFATLDEAQIERWRRYRLPAAEEPSPFPLLACLTRHLAHAPEEPLDLPTFTERVVAQEPALWPLTPFWEAEEGLDRASEVAQEFLRGPLAWFGVVVVEENTLALTPLGRWLLAEGVPPAMPAPALLQWVATHSSDELRLLAPPDTPPLLLLYLESFALWQGWQAGARGYAITSERLRAALARDLALPDLLRLLDRHCQDGLSPAQRQTLTEWATPTRRLHFQQVTIVEGDPALLEEIASTRRLRRHLHRSLSPRAIIVKEQGLPKFQKQLERRGIAVTGSLSAEKRAYAPSTSAHAAYLLTAARVYAALSRWLPLPYPMPLACLRDLEQQLDAATLTATQQAVEDLLAALVEVIDGRSADPGPHPGLPLETTLPLIRQAIEEERELHLTYWVAGSGERTQRIIEPHRLETDGSLPRLTAYCQLKQAERCFRLDRIEAIHLGDTLAHPF